MGLKDWFLNNKKNKSHQQKCNQRWKVNNAKILRLYHPYSGFGKSWSMLKYAVKNIIFTCLWNRDSDVRLCSVLNARVCATAIFKFSKSSRLRESQAAYLLHSRFVNNWLSYKLQSWTKKIVAKTTKRRSHSWPD